jgi:hypothetical protein
MAKKAKNRPQTPDDEIIRALKAENRALRQEVSVLKRELEEASGKRFRHPRHQKGDPNRALLVHQANNEVLFSKKRYFTYVLHLISSTSVFSIYKSILAFLRRYSFISMTLQILFAVLTVLQSSAIILIATSASFLALPFILICSYAVFFFAHFHRKRNDVNNRRLLAQKRIFVFFPPKKRALSPDSFFSGMVEEFSHQEDTICIVVSPHFWRNRGLFGNKRIYRFSRTESEHILLVRRQYYFMLKKNVFNEASNEITEIY